MVFGSGAGSQSGSGLVQNWLLCVGFSLPVFFPDPPLQLLQLELKVTKKP